MKVFRAFLIFSLTSFVTQHAQAEIIFGEIRELQGNCMPPGPCRSFPVSTEVFLVKGQVRNPQATTGIHLSILPSETIAAVTSSEANGHFSFDVTPGIYTIFAKFGEIAYNNSFDGHGFFGSFELHEGKNIEVNIENTDHAIF